MVGFLLIAHAPLAQAFVAAAQHVFGDVPAQLEALDVHADQAQDDIQNRVREAVARLHSGAGVLVMTDTKGASPCNGCSALAEPGRVEIVAGLSLPMLLRALTYRGEPLDVVREMALIGAQNGAVRVDPRIRIAP